MILRMTIFKTLLYFFSIKTDGAREVFDDQQIKVDWTTKQSIDKEEATGILDTMVLTKIGYDET